MLIPDGFSGQRILVLPASRTREFERSLISPSIAVAACGYFPRAKMHGMVRRSPINQLVMLACMEGEGWCDTPAGRFSVGAGDVVLLPPGEPHSYGASSDAPWTLRWVHIVGAGLPDFRATFGIGLESPIIRPIEFHEIAGLLGEIMRAIGTDLTDRNMLRAAGAAWHLLALIGADRSGLTTTGMAIQRAAEHIRTHLPENIRVAELAAIAHLSSSHFSAEFRKAFGYSVIEYQAQARMLRARELLDNTRISISEVGAAVGYGDPFYFSRQFRRIHGVPPRSYRAGDRGGPAVG